MDVEELVKLFAAPCAPSKKELETQAEIDRLTAENIALRAERDALLKHFNEPIKTVERGGE